MSSVMAGELEHSHAWPIEQLVRRTDTRFQGGFAREAATRVPGGEDFRLHASAEGLLVLGRNEEALGRPIAILRDAYGAVLHAGHPRVRYAGVRPLYEPVMHLRIALDGATVDAVKRVLQARGATLLEDEVRGARAVLRYEAPLARLLGVAEELARASPGGCDHAIALSHYAPVRGDPGGSAA